MGVNLADEDFKERRQRRKVFRKTGRCSPEATFCKFLDNKRYEGDEEDDEDGDDATFNPAHDWQEICASSWLQRIGDGDIPVVAAEDCLVFERTQIDHREHEHLDRKDDEQVVDVETGMGVVERQEPIERKLGAEIIVLARKHLFAHASTDLGCEVENGTETKVTAFTALVVFAVLDAAAS